MKTKKLRRKKIFSLLVRNLGCAKYLDTHFSCVIPSSTTDMCVTNKIFINCKRLDDSFEGAGVGKQILSGRLINSVANTCFPVDKTASTAGPTNNTHEGARKLSPIQT
jgi:hypothetical protein